MCITSTRTRALSAISGPMLSREPKSETAIETSSSNRTISTRRAYHCTHVQAGLHRADVSEHVRADIRTIDLVGDAGVAVLVETDYFGCDFVDFFTVARIDGRWWITNKTYAHTGGTPPPG